MLNLDLTDRRALVTGASLGIGAAAVRMLADHGAAVAFCARGEEAVDELATYAPPSGAGSVKGYVADMGAADSVDALLDQVAGDGNVDIVVNNVGASPSRNFLYMEDEAWESLFQLNLMSAVRCTRKLLPGMREQKWGRVVMVASQAAKYPGAALIDYGATKAAMVATGKALSGKYGRDGVLFNSVLPGLIRTAMWERAAGEISEARGGDAEEVFAANSKSVPVGRYGTAEEVAAVIVFLCTDAAAYVNGAVIDVDGGQGRHI
ncbi:MAG: SDR family oxidoreductase [Acidobacteriota bacterium]|nr:SDR family oxidoreductase [Acidobacteriota bacterium]